MKAVRWFWLDVPSACGAIATDADGVVVDGCPYFRKAYKGKRLNDVIQSVRRAGRAARWQALPDA